MENSTEYWVVGNSKLATRVTVGDEDDLYPIGEDRDTVRFHEFENHQVVGSALYAEYTVTGAIEFSDFFSYAAVESLAGL